MQRMMDYLVATLARRVHFTRESFSLVVEDLQGRPGVSVAIVHVGSGETVSLETAPDCQLAVEGPTLWDALQKLDNMCREDFGNPRTLTRA
jgi:hypothetical protein